MRKTINIVMALNWFYLAFELNLNSHKSNLCRVGVARREIGYFKDFVGCRHGKFPFIHFGIPTGAKIKKVFRV